MCYYAAVKSPETFNAQRDALNRFLATVTPPPRGERLLHLTHALVEAVNDAIMAELGQSPPPCTTPLLEAVTAASERNVPRIINRIEEALLQAELLAARR